MLVIRRRAGEAFLINGNIEVEILEVGSTQVKLGIVAPKEISILRKEIYSIGKQNQAASRHISSLELASLAQKLNF